MSNDSKFIELNRRFRKLDPKAKPEDVAVESYSFELIWGDKGFGWEDLLKRSRVVILGEPGSGKSWEFRERARILTEQGYFAFFIRLDQLIDQNIEYILTADELKRFATWKRGERRGFFFLDSVDEAKFHSLRDFHSALDKLKTTLGSDALDRSDIFLSSRISEWQPENDAYEFNRRFPLPPRERRKGDGQKAVDSDDALLVVQFCALSQGQVENLARGIGVTDVEAFISALDKNFAWEFARRPLDVRDLVGLWNEQRRIGSLTEIVEFAIRSKLQPRTGRDEYSLSEAEAREGAEWLAAATVFARQFTFRIPDDTWQSVGGLDSRAFIPASWRPDACRALLMRALFDGASYGRIRFHDRRVAEYLAARWLAARMDADCPIYVLESLLVEKVGSRAVLRPALAPIAAWLCDGEERWNHAVRAWVLEAGPGVHLKYGDPARLSLEYKRQVLHALARLSQGRRRLWLNASNECLARLADPALAPDVAALIRDRTLAVDLRIEMLELVRYGQMRDCLQAAVDVLISADEPEELKLYAASAIGAFQDIQSRNQLKQIAKQLSRIPNQLCARIVRALFPDALDSRELVEFLAKTEEVEDRSAELPYYLTSHFESTVTPETAGDLLSKLLGLAQAPPLFNLGDKTIPISDQFHWIGKVIPMLLRTLLKKSRLSDSESDTGAQALWLLGYLRECDFFYDETLGNLNPDTAGFPEVRRKYLWRLVESFRAERRKEPTMSFDLFDHWEVLRLMPHDFKWLVEEIRQQQSTPNRLIALRLALESWFSSGRKHRDLRAIRTSLGGDVSLIACTRECVRNTRFLRIKRFWNGITNRLRYGRWRRQGFAKLRQRWGRFRKNIVLWRHLRLLASGKPVGWLANLSREADENTNDRWAPATWADLERNRGKRIARAARQGCKAAWRQFTPLLPHEKPIPSRTDLRVIVGLAGLKAAVEDGEMDFSTLTADEARLATRYAVNELNGFAPWLPTLAQVHPEAVGSVLCDCVKAEWAFSPERKESPEVLHDLVWHGETLIPLVQPTLVSLLRDADPANSMVLHSSLAVLVRQKNAPLSELREIAAQRVSDASVLRSKVLWLAVWLQTDSDAALSFLEARLSNLPDADQIVVGLCSILHGEHIERSPITANPDHMRPAALRRFIPLVYTHVRFADDIDRVGGGGYTPEARDYAQRFRGALLEALAQHQAPEATGMLRELAREPQMTAVRDWILNLLEQRLEREANLSPWTGDDLRSFAAQHEIDPKNDKELFSIAVKRLRELKYDVEESDNSLRDELHADQKELHFRRWLARKLNERSKGRYSVPQEPEIDLQQCPDLRFLNPRTGPASVEAKLANLGWSVGDLLERLENQFVGQYLRAHKSRFGIYVIGTIGSQQHWKHPQTGQLLEFSQVIELISQRAAELMRADERIGDLAVFGLDFREPKKV